VLRYAGLVLRPVPIRCRFVRRKVGPATDTRLPGDSPDIVEIDRQATRRLDGVQVEPTDLDLSVFTSVYLVILDFQSAVPLGLVQFVLEFFHRSEQCLALGALRIDTAGTQHTQRVVEQSYQIDIDSQGAPQILG